jgi:hypothetical protein
MVTRPSYYPLKVGTFVSARETAIEESGKYPDFFFYLMKHSGGGYVIDIQGVLPSNTKHIATYKEGKNVTDK